MHTLKNIKIILGITYILVISIFLWFLFKNFSIQDFTSYQIIKENMDTLKNLKESNILFSSILFILFTVIWIFLLGFALPIFLVGGFLFGKWLGTILVVLSLSLGATLFYMFANFFLKEFIKEKLSYKYHYLISRFEKNEFLYFLVYRFIGGIPFFIANTLPVIFNIKIKNYFFGTLIGMIPQLFIMVSIGSGLEKIIDANTTPPTFFEIIFSKDIYLPLIAFLFIVIISIFLKKKLYK